MTTIINASTTNGLVQTADGSGVLKVQSNGVTTNALAWVNFTGATPTIKASYNVSSITRGGAGNYTINFATALSDANYVVAGCGCSAGQGLSAQVYPGTTPSTTAFNGNFNSYNNTYTDPTFGGYVVFGN